MRHVFSVRIGPVGFRVGSDWRAPIAELERLYADYPVPEDGIADFTVRLFAARPWRRWLRPAVTLGGDFVLPEAAPLLRIERLTHADDEPIDFEFLFYRGDAFQYRLRIERS